MPRLVIIADDLTGAGDSAAHLASRADVVMLFQADHDWPEATVVALDTDSRHAAPTEAAERVAAAVRRAASLGAAIFKKIDSTLRGNVAVEIRAAADALAESGAMPLVVMAPAFPSVGRTTVRGVVHVNNQPLTEAVHEGNVVELLATQGFRTELVGRPTSADEVTARLKRATERGMDAVVVDAESDEDLRLIVIGSLATDRPILLVGSGGLARPFDEVLEDTSGRAPAALPDGPILFVVGSYCPQARSQRQALVEVGVAEAIWSEGISSGELSRTIRAGLGQGAVVLSPDVNAPVDRDRTALVADGLAAAAAAALDDVATLVATGGETARAILNRQGVDHLRIIGELEPGVVLAHLDGRNLSVVTKAGAFGDVGVLVRRLSTHPHQEA
jgi:uncharacterized protein YgbK (DUF1537 family)